MTQTREEVIVELLEGGFISEEQVEKINAQPTMHDFRLARVLHTLICTAKHDGTECGFIEDRRGENKDYLDWIRFAKALAAYEGMTTEEFRAALIPHTTISNIIIGVMSLAKPNIVRDYFSALQEGGIAWRTKSLLDPTSVQSRLESPSTQPTESSQSMDVGEEPLRMEGSLVPSDSNINNKE